MIINTFNSGNNGMANSKTHHRQFMTTITNRILKFEPMIKKPIAGNHTFLLLFLLATSIPSLISILLEYNIYKAHLSKSKRLIFIRITEIIIKITYHLCGYNFLTAIL